MKTINVSILILSLLFNWCTFALSMGTYWYFTSSNYEKCVVITEVIEAKLNHHEFDLNKITDRDSGFCYRFNRDDNYSLKLPYWVQMRFKGF